MGAADYRARWQLENPGNRASIEERQRVFGDLLRSSPPPRDLPLLDLGCGGASLLPDLDHIDTFGIDLLFERLHVEGHQLAGRLVNADGSALPFRNASFGIVTLFTVMSSVPDESVRARIAVEIDRILCPGGVVVFYDLRLPNPRNRFIRPLSRRAWSELFPSYHRTIQSLTVLPPVARRLGRTTPVTYGIASRLPLLRSHNAGVLRKV